jgi:hypothetical protein
MTQYWARPAARYTPRLLSAIQRRYEDSDEPMQEIAFAYGISLRTLHRMAEREGWRKRGDRPPKDLHSSELLLQSVQALQRGDQAAAEALLRESREASKAEQDRLQRLGRLPPGR